MKAETKTKTADRDLTEYNLVLKKNFASQISKLTDFPTFEIIFNTNKYVINYALLVFQ